MISHRTDIQLLRGLAVLFVLLYHLNVNGFENGYLGVDLFFVLSGFLMALLCEKSNILEFYNRRLRRLLPAYLATIFFTSLLVAIITIPSDANQRFERLWFDIIGLSNIAFWIENSYFESESFKPLLNLWSLAVELQFYLIAPFLLPFLRYRSSLTLLFILSSLFACIFFLTISPKTSFFMMPLRLWEFLLGALVAWYPFKSPSLVSQQWVTNILLILLFAVFFLYPLSDDSLSIFYGHPSLAAVLIAILTALLIALKIDRTFISQGILARFLSTLGDYSYSIYLVHFPVIVLWNYKGFEGTKLGYDKWTDSLIIMFITLAISYFMFHYVESLRSSKKFMRSIYIAFIFLIILGFSAPHLNKFRFTDEQLKIFNAWEDRSTYRCGKVFQLFKLGETVCSIDNQNGISNVLLLGNSHADSIKIPFARALNENNYSTYFYAANNPLMSEKTNAEFIASDVSRLNIEKVIIHYSSSFYSKEFYQSQLQDFIYLLRKKEVEIIFISPVPSYEFNVPKHLYLQTLNIDEVSRNQNIKEYLYKNDNFYKIVKQLAISNKNIFHSQEYICPDNACLLSINGKPIYFDSSHLTITGANTLYPIFNKIANK